MDFQKLLNSTEYDFIRNNERLGNRIMLLGLGGSYAYGTNNEGSDIDFRGVTLMMPSDLLGLTEFEQYEDDKTDTVIYGFNKLVRLLLECNPNTIEMLGLDEEQYLIKSSLGQELLDNRTAIDELLEAKKRTTEKEENPQMPVIKKYIEEGIKKQKVIADELADDHNKDWSALDKVFIETI